MRFSTRQLILLTASIAAVTVLGLPFYREFTRPQNCSYTVAASNRPGVNGYTFYDSDQNVRVVVLEKITLRVTGKRGRNMEPEWLQYSISANRQIALRVDGSPVYFGDGIVVFYTVDGGKPNRMVVPSNSISQFEFPHQLWSRLIR